MKNYLSNKWVRFAITATIYFLWVIWLENYWWFIGLGVIFDLYITKKVHWSFWKKKNPPNGRQTKVVEWVDAIIFAVIAATFIRMFFIEAYTIPTSSMEKSMLVGDYLFVSKTAYGPKMPNTPLSVPFVHHTMPLSKTKKSYSDIIKLDYRRIGGLGEVKRDDVVVFNYPEGDTVSVVYQSNVSYNQLVREEGRTEVNTNKRRFGDIVYRPVDKRENYIKRCVAIHGDSLKIVDGQVFVNNKPQKDIPGLQYEHIVTTDGTAINPRTLDKLNISVADRHRGGSQYSFPLTEEQATKLRAFKNVISVKKITFPTNSVDKYIFPFDNRYPWNIDNYGPIWIPESGTTINLTVDNLPLYKRAIRVYEGNEIEVKDGDIYINGEKSDSYTFKMDYYWMMGDNRRNSADSRFWGFVPQDHIVGKGSFVWLSLDKDKSFLSKIRWNRLFTVVK
jgi:signal peptidase I